VFEREKLVLKEQLENKGQNKHPFGEMFKLTMQFLENPLNIWRSGQLPHKRTVLKLAFADRLTYSRKTGFQTPKTSCVFSMIGWDSNPRKAYTFASFQD
jgi:site-specific DNA recombinase